MSTHKHDDAALLIYRVGPVLCCASSHPVLGVIQPPPVTRVPGSSARRPGIVTYAGRVVPITDLRVAFGVAESERQSPGRLIVVELGDHQVGFHVDRIGDVIPWPNEGWGPLPSMLPREVFSRTWHRNEQIHLFADFDRLDALQADGVLRQYIEQLQHAELQHIKSPTSEQKRPAESTTASAAQGATASAAKVSTRQMTADTATAPSASNSLTAELEPASRKSSAQRPTRIGDSSSKIPQEPVSTRSSAKKSTSQTPRKPSAKAMFNRPPSGSAANRPPADADGRQTRQTRPTGIAIPQQQNQGGADQHDSEPALPAAVSSQAITSPPPRLAPRSAPADSSPQPSSQTPRRVAPRPSPSPTYDHANNSPVWPLVLLLVVLATSGSLAWLWLTPVTAPVSEPRSPRFSEKHAAENNPEAPIVPLPEVTVRNLEPTVPDSENQSDDALLEAPDNVDENWNTAEQTHQAPAPSPVLNTPPAADSAADEIFPPDASPSFATDTDAPTAADAESKLTAESANDESTAFQAEILRDDGGITIVLNTPRDTAAFKLPAKPERPDTRTDELQSIVERSQSDDDAVADFSTAAPRNPEAEPAQRETSAPTAREIESTHTLEQAAAPQLINEIIHIVVKGDTLWHIAKRYVNDPFRYPELARLSNIRNPDLIYPGDRVRIIQVSY